MLSPTEEAIADLKSATLGFDHIFSNQLDKAEELFKTNDSALHLLGSGACAFLQAALSLEVRTPYPMVQAMSHTLTPPGFRQASFQRPQTS
jgi:Protein of unknown function (DUF3808)